MNCKGFKQSCDYIIKRLINDCDVMCLSETWLRPGDLYLVDKALKRDVRSSLNQYSVFSKSGICQIHLMIT